MLVQNMLNRTAARFPDKVALVCRGQRLTYGQIETMANRFANALLHHGVRRGDRVAIHLPSCVEAENEETQSTLVELGKMISKEIYLLS